jgi:hypothetical protein
MPVSLLGGTAMDTFQNIKSSQGHGYKISAHDWLFLDFVVFVSPCKQMSWPDPWSYLWIFLLTNFGFISAKDKTLFMLETSVTIMV